MRTSRKRSHTMRHYRWPMAAGLAVLIVILLALSFENRTSADGSVIAEVSPSTGPPWRYGHSDARFTLIEYADLECPYCQMYFPVLRHWIDANPDVNWQWHHLPLPMHEPAATHGGRLAECAGETDGQTAFWNTVAWIYQHTLGDGQGLPPAVQLPSMTPALQACLASTRPDAVIRVQAEEAAQAGIVATPTLRVLDNHTGESLLLSGAVEGDALLSAIDLLASSSDASAEAETPSEILEMPADPVSDMPR